MILLINGLLELLLVGLIDSLYFLDSPAKMNGIAFGFGCIKGKEGDGMVVDILLDPFRIIKRGVMQILFQENCAIGCDAVS